MRILFCCTGNTCRSPMAEGLLNARHNPDQTAVSAGLMAYENDPVSANSVKAMASRGIDISAHRAHRLTQKDIDDADIVVPMDERYVPYILANYRVSDGKIPFAFSVPDPYGGDEATYRLCADSIEKQLNDALPDIRINQANDLSAIADYEASAFSDGLSKKTLSESIMQDNYRLYGLFVDKKQVAYTVVSLSCDEAQILSVGSLDRGKGYATKLLDEACRRLTKENIRTVFLEVRLSNSTAIHVYERLGFIRDGVRKHLYTRPDEDGIIMHKDLITC